MKWLKTIVWNGVQKVWSIDADPTPNVSIVRDSRQDPGTEYPYALHVNDQYHGHYRHLAQAKKDALVYLKQ